MTGSITGVDGTFVHVNRQVLGAAGVVEFHEWDSPQPTVLKLGGSLLDIWNLGNLLRAFCCGRRVLIVTGGGAAADTVRRLDACCGLRSDQSHWMAIQAMSFNAGLLMRTVSGLCASDGLEQSPGLWPEGRPLVLDPARWLLSGGRSVAARIPASWDATSDSIAAIVAGAIGVDSVILGKSCEPCGTGIADLAAGGQVDVYFPSFSRAMKIGWCNFRAAVPSVVCLQR